MNRILIMDSDKGLLEIMTTVLSCRGFEVKISAPQVDINHLVEFHQPNLIILGYTMGNINGGTLCTALKGDHRNRNIPVIILPGYKEELILPESCGCDLFYPKPIDVAFLISSIQNLLRSHAKS